MILNKLVSENTSCAFYCSGLSSPPSLSAIMMNEFNFASEIIAFI